MFLFNSVLCTQLLKPSFATCYIVMCTQILFTYDNFAYQPTYLDDLWSNILGQQKNEGKWKVYTNLQTLIINICATKNYAQYTISYYTCFPLILNITTTCILLTYGFILNKLTISRL